MAYRALIFGAIGVMAETSELQRQAYNLAFKQSGLNWTWDPARYKRLLQRPGGVRRVADYAALRGDYVDAEAVHARKVANFRAAVLREGLIVRPGVLELIRAAQVRSIRLAWATTTVPQTVELMLEGLAGSIPSSLFSYIGDRSHVERGKPAPDIYLRTLIELGVEPNEALSIEDTPESAEAALAAGIAVVGFPGKAAEDRAFPAGTMMTHRLDASLLSEMETA